MWTYEPLLPGLEVSELERGALENFENPDILEDFLMLNAGEQLPARSKQLPAPWLPCLEDNGHSLKIVRIENEMGSTIRDRDGISLLSSRRRHRRHRQEGQKVNVLEFP